MGKPDELLSRLHDGELDAAGEKDARASLDERDRAVLESLAQVGAAVRGVVAAERAAAPVDLWAGIAERLPPPAAATETPGVEVASKRRALRSWRERARRLGVWGLVVPAVAAAGLAALVAVRLGVPISNLCDVESLEVAGSTATVLKLHDAGKTTVIWTTEEQ